MEQRMVGDCDGGYTVVVDRTLEMDEHGSVAS